MRGEEVSWYRQQQAFFTCPDLKGTRREQLPDCGEGRRGPLHRSWGLCNRRQPTCCSHRGGSRGGHVSTSVSSYLPISLQPEARVGVSFLGQEEEQRVDLEGQTENLPTGSPCYEWDQPNVYALLFRVNSVPLQVLIILAKIQLH